MAENKKINNDKVKNGIIIALVLIIVFGGSFLASEMKNNKKGNSGVNGDTINLDDLDVNEDATTAQDEAAAIKEEEKKAHNPITVEEYLNLKEGKKKSIIYIARPTCSFCTYADPILQHIAFKNDLTINYLNTDEVSEEESVDIINSDEYFKDGFGTPLVIIVQNKKIIDAYEGLTDTKTYTKFLKDNGVL